MGALAQSNLLHQIFETKVESAQNFHEFVFDHGFGGQELVGLREHVQSDDLLLWSEGQTSELLLEVGSGWQCALEDDLFRPVASVEHAVYLQ